jgi:hypothetical protein
MLRVLAAGGKHVADACCGLYGLRFCTAETPPAAAGGSGVSAVHAGTDGKAC